MFVIVKICFIHSGCRFCEQIWSVLGFDWLLLFASSTVHKTTVLRALRILFKMLMDSTALNNFQNGLLNGGWLEGSEILTAKKQSTAAG